MTFSNPFKPTTVGGRAARTLYKDIHDDNEFQGVAGSSGVISPGNASAPQKTSADYEAEDREETTNYIIALSATDSHALGKLTILNRKKQEIVDIMSTVFTSINNTGVNYPSVNERLVSSTGSVSDSTGEKVTYMAGISTFIYPDGCVSTAATDPECISGSDCCLVGVRAEIYPDIIAAWHYPNVESLSVGEAFYKEGESYVKVTSSNLGIGVSAYEFGDAAGNTGYLNLVTSGSSLGYYYFFSNLSSVNSGAATSITNLVSDIESLRTEINNLYTDSTNGTNKMRALKSRSNVNLWFEKKGQAGNNQITNFQDGLDGLNQNRQIIQDYNS